MTEYACPKCKGSDLTVVVRASARLIQDEYGGFETDTDCTDHEWDENSRMTCRDCGSTHDAGSFYTGE